MYCHSIDRYWKLHNEYNQRCMYTHLQHSFRDRPQPFLRPLVEPINVTTIHQRGKHPQASAKRVADRAETQNNVQIFTAPLDKRVVLRHGVVVVVVGHALLSPPANQSHRKKSVSSDHTRHCNYTSNTQIKIHVRIHSTFKVIRACIFIVLSVLEVTQRVQPTCIIHVYARTPTPHHRRQTSCRTVLPSAPPFHRPETNSGLRPCSTNC